MRYSVIGSREFEDYDLLKETLDKHFIYQIVSGGAPGADTLAARYAEAHNIPLLEFIPNWDKYKNAAAMIRNKDIIKASDVTIAFWNGISNGTRGALDIARKLGKKVIIIRF